MVHFRRQQQKAAGQYGKHLQKIPGFCQHGFPFPRLHLLEEIGAPDVVQGLKQDKQEIGKVPGIAVVAHCGGIHQGVQHQRVHLIENQVGQVVKYRGEGQNQAEFPIFLMIKGFPPQHDGDADAGANQTVGQGIGDHPAHIPGLVGHLQNQDNCQRQRHQCHHEGQNHVPACPKLVDIFLVQKLRAEGAEGLKQHQQHQRGP